MTTMNPSINTVRVSWPLPLKALAAVDRRLPTSKQEILEAMKAVLRA
jgi:hypothetical protein